MVGRLTLKSFGPILAAAILIGLASVAAAEPDDTDFEDESLPTETRDSAHNERDNASQIDTVQETEQATEKPHELTSDDLARELASPNTPLARLTFEINTTFFDNDVTGNDKTEVANFLLFQPIFPFPLTDDGTTNLFVRPAFTFFTKSPVFDAGDANFDSESGFGDWGYDIALGRSYDSGIIVVGGVQGTIPIGEDDFTGDTWRMGPEFIMAHLNKERAFAIFPQHQWDFAGNGDDFSSTTIQPIYLKFLSGGWVVGTSPEIVYDWKNNQLTLPIDLEVRKLVKMGNVPVQLKMNLDYFVERDDDFGPKFQIKVSFTPIVKNFIYALFND